MLSRLGSHDEDKEKCQASSERTRISPKCASISQIKTMLHQVEALLDRTAQAQAA